jgi:hypothetical protein
VHYLGSASLPGQIICDVCLDWHNRAIEMLAGAAIPPCQECDAQGETRLYVVPRDGVYQVLCARCVGPYVSKRTDLYRGTAFGADVERGFNA